MKWSSVLIAITAATAISQTSSNTALVSGRVLDSNTRTTMEYVNIVLFSVSDSSIVTGTVTDARGVFQLTDLREGNYYLEARFMGYQTHRLDKVLVEELTVNLGDIRLIPTTIGIGEMLVERARPTVTYQIDKKVLDVDQLSTTISGTAADVLANVPSVTVDIEGNVSLRGSGNFTVLIDGRPSILNAQDALQQIPASTIGRIEIITNPSAKYDPSGTAGIINIVMKEHRTRGLTGAMNANVGLNDKYGGDILLEHNDGSMSTLLGVDYADRVSPGTSDAEERYEYQGITSFTRSSGDMRMLRSTFGLRGALEFDVGERGTATIGGRYGKRSWERNSTLQHSAWSSLEPQPLFSQNALHRRRGGEFAGLNAGYRHGFAQEGHTLSGDVRFRYRDSDELTISELVNNDRLMNGRRTTEAGPSSEVNGRIEYILPFSEASKFEAGYEGEIDISEEATTLSDHDSTTGQYVLLPQFSHDVRYKDNEQALYSLYSGALGQFGYQLGLRGEYTQRTIRLVQGPEFLIDRWDFFPTFHASYKFTGGNMVMASYTRRIDRPGGRHLEPFETWIDANNVFRGNPSLLPEYIDSYEVGGQTLFGDVSLSLELYHRVNHNKTEDIRSVYSENVALTTVDNVGTEYSSGTELLANFDLVRDWNVNLIGTAYDYRINGVLLGEPFSTRSFNWRGRWNNIVRLGTSTQMQVNTMWNSPSVSPQRRREGFLSVDVAAKQEILDRQLSLTLQLQNVLNTARHEFTSQGAGVYTYNDRRMESPVVMLTLRFNLNNHVREREREREEGNEEEF